jgi:hypothetical protein
MDFFFKSQGCPACDFVYQILQRKQENWTGSLKIVELQFDSKTEKLMTYIDGKESGEAPVGLVPAYYSAAKDELVTGLDAVMKELDNANWNN